MYKFLFSFTFVIATNDIKVADTRRFSFPLYNTTVSWKGVGGIIRQQSIYIGVNGY